MQYFSARVPKRKVPTVLHSNISLGWSSTGVTVAGITGWYGKRSDQLNGNRGLAFDTSDRLYIADGGNRIQRWSIGASNGITMAGQENGTDGSGLASLYFPQDVAIDSSGSIFIVDTFNCRVMFWPPGAPTGKQVTAS
ncbi:unnamed protein product, partial [Rotaria sp. Silwood1]